VSSKKSGDTSGVTLYWRPGCGFCMGLERGLSPYDLDIGRRNIWEDPGAADFVRAHTGGNETVPTVDVAGHVMVNPTAKQLLAAMHEHTPHLLPADFEPPEPGAVAKFVGRILGG
jgi:mycoredoxin